MYQNGFNCKNIIIQSLSAAIIEIVIRVYFSIKSVKQYREDFQLSEDYSNFEEFKHFFQPANKEKLNEMLLVAHAIVTAINVGKVVIKKSPWEINVAEIFAVVKYGVKILDSTVRSNSEYAKLLRNTENIHQTWQTLEKEICCSEDKVVNDIADILVI